MDSLSHDLLENLHDLLKIPQPSDIEIRKGTERDYSQNMKELWDLEDYSSSFLNDEFEQDPREKVSDVHWKEVVNMDLLNENTFFEMRIGLPNEDSRTFDIDISTTTFTLFSHKYKVKYFFPNEVESKPIFCKWKKDQCILEVVLNPK
uniref:PIH1D1/2/3 CS-like domain-containing protein n=1 Tax=Lepeophtheirus salmonis TaxID=72036 RepID=A0A0K2UPT0_LEPSM